jgi:hypothetical protein
MGRIVFDGGGICESNSDENALKSCDPRRWIFLDFAFYFGEVRNEARNYFL